MAQQPVNLLDGGSILRMGGSCSNGFFVASEIGRVRVVMVAW